MRKILIGIILLINGYCYASDYRMASSLSITGGTLTGDLTAPNITATYGVSAATGVFSGAMTIGGVLNVNNDMTIGAGNKLDLGGATGNGGFRIINNIAHFENGQSGAKRAFALVDFVNRSADYSTPIGTPVSPTFFVFSSTPVATATNQWISMTHNSYSGVINSGVGGVNFESNVGIASSTPMGLLTVGAGASFFRVNSTGQIFANSLGAAGTGTALVISATNEIIPLTSSRRFKNNIVPMKVSSDKLSLLKPVEFDYKSGGHAIGFIAEDVVKIYPSVVNKDKEGKPYSISYDQFIPILVDKINKLEARIKVLEGK